MKHLRGDLNYKAIWEELKGTYRSLCLRCVAVKEDEIWRNIMMFFSLSRKDMDIAKKEIEGDHKLLERLGLSKLKKITFLYDVFEASHFPKLIEKLNEGEVTIGNQIVKLRDGYEQSKWHREAYHVLPFGECIEYPPIVYQIHAKVTPYEIKNVGEINEELSSLGILNGIEEIGRQWLKIGTMGLTLNAMIVAPLYLRPLEIKLEGAKLNFKLKIHKELQQKVLILVALRRKAGDVSTAIENASLGVPTQFEEEDFIVSNIEYKFEKYPNMNDEILVRLSGNLGIFFEELKMVEDLLPFKVPTDVFASLATRFVKLNELEKALTKGMIEGKDIKFNPARGFQRAVTWLLSIIGFKTLELGDTNYGTFRREDRFELGEADSIVQDVEKGGTYVIQCKAKPPDSSEIDKIANLATYLRERGVTSVQPLLFVMESARELKQNRRGVKIVDKDDIVKTVKYIREDNIGEAKKVITEPQI